MIIFKNESKIEAYIKLKKFYDEAVKNGQKSIDAMAISSYSPSNREVNSRFVNLKIIDNKDFIFFSNYNSVKADEFKQHSQVALLIYWNSINVQIRIKGLISKTPSVFNDIYFRGRSLEKNALAISSDQSKEIMSFSEVKKKYEKVKNSADLEIRPDYWGGYSIAPNEIEFWKGDKFRLNFRERYKNINNEWTHAILEP